MIVAGIPGDPVVLHDESPDCWKCIYNVGQLAILSSSGPAPATANNSQDYSPAQPPPVLLQSIFVCTKKQCSGSSLGRICALPEGVSIAATSRHRLLNKVGRC